MATNGNAAVYFVDRHADGDASSKPAFIEGSGLERTLTYKELASQTECMGSLLARHGIDREQRVAVLVLDQIEFPIIFWGSIKAGVIPIALNTLLASDVYSTILNDCRPVALFVSAELYAIVAPAIAQCRSLRKIFITGAASHPDCLNFSTEMAAPEVAAREPLPTVWASPDECAFWLYSSGSTGRPKGVQHVHSSLKATSDTYGKHIVQISADDVIFSAAKLFFAYGLGNSMTFPMSVGATTWLLGGRPTPESVLAILAKANPSLFFGVPTLYAALLANLGDTPPAGTQQLRCCVSAGEALPADIGLPI